MQTSIPQAPEREAAAASPTEAAAHHPPSGGQRLNFLLVLPFLLLFYVQLAHHQMWGDELNAWEISVASASLKQLFGYLHYEAHPSLWYVLLWPVTRFTAAPVAMKGVEALVGTAIYLWIALKSPFSRVEKVLLYLSYFISFEYTVPSRMYGVLFLLALIYAQQRATRPGRIFSNALLLGLMANTDTMGILVSSALAAEYALERLSHSAPLPSGPDRRSQRPRLAAAALLYLAFAAFSVWSLKPAPDISRINSGYRFEHAREISHFGQALLRYVVLPWFPIAHGFPHHFWNPSLKSHPVLYLLAFPVVVAMLYGIFRRDRTLLFLVGFMALIGVTFGHLIYMGWERHYGILFTAFLVALWIQRYRRPRIPAAAYVLLGLGALAGVEAAVAQWTHPFSNSQGMADWIRARHLQDLPIVSAYDMGVAEILERPIYFIECSCTDTFVLFSDRRDHFSWDQAPDRIERAMHEISKPQALFISTDPLSQEQIEQLQQRSIRLTPLLTLPDAEVTPEGNYLYRIQSAASLGASPALRNARPPNLATARRPLARPE